MGDETMLRHDAKSLALFQAIQAKLAADPQRRDKLKAARDWARRFSLERPEDIWLAEWVDRLDAVLQADEPTEALGNLYALMLSTDQHAIDMRSSSPFAGVLTVQERTHALLVFERGWDDRRTA